MRWIYSTNAKDIGIQYIITGGIGGIIGTSQSIMIRIEQSEEGENYQNKGEYNIIITNHGIQMIFYMVMPIQIGGIGNWQTPIMIGASDMAYPRQNNISIWQQIISINQIMLTYIGGGIGTGWTIYPPQADTPYNTGGIIDLAIQSIHIAGISSIIGGINIISTIINMRIINKQSLMIWSIQITTQLQIIALPVLAGGITMQITDRNYNTSYYDTKGGGDPIIYQQLAGSI